MQDNPKLGHEGERRRFKAGICILALKIFIFLVGICLKISVNWPKRHAKIMQHCRILTAFKTPLTKIGSRPILVSGHFQQLICRKQLDIFSRTIPQFFPREKFNKSLRPFDIKGRTVRPYPVPLQASLKGILKSLSCRRLVWNFFSHKTPQLQTVIVVFSYRNRQNKYIT